MKTYIETLLEEKGISTETTLLKEEGNFNLTIEMLLGFVYSLPKKMVLKIEATFRKIDFLNGDIKHYVDFLANGMINHNN